jgi:hypothetical protein
MRTIVIVGGVAAYAAASFVVYLAVAPAPGPVPHLVLESMDGGFSFTVTEAEAGLQWEDFRPVGCNRRPSGAVEVGDQVTHCAGTLALQYTGKVRQ